MRIEFIKSSSDIKKDMKCISSIGRISRSKKTLKENYKDIELEDHLKFNERWYKESNHRSLGDLASIHLDISGISIIAAKLLEIARIGVGFCEFSTRYVDIEKNNFEDLYYTPTWLDKDNEELKNYKVITEMHFNAYKTVKNKINKKLKDEFGKEINKKNGIKLLDEKEILDNARYSLPTNTKVGLGIHCNVRALESIMIKMKWYSIIFSEADLIYKELRKLVLKNKAVLSTINIEKIDSIDTTKAWFDNNNRIYWDLIPLFHELSLNENLSAFADKFFEKIEMTAKNQIYPYLNSYDKSSILPNKSVYFSNSILSKYLKNIKEKDLFHNENLYIPRLFELINFSYDCEIDFGSFRDISRHRICSMIYTPIPIRFVSANDYFTDSYYLSPIMTQVRKLRNKNKKKLSKSLPDDLLFLDYNQFQLRRYSSCVNIKNQFDQKSIITGSYYYNDINKMKAFFRCIEYLAYTQPLSAQIDFILDLNLREAIKIVNQRETKYGHPSYVEFARKLRENIEIALYNYKRLQ